MLLTVARVPSNGLVTSVSTSCGAAPGKEMKTAAMGKLMFGSKSTGVRLYDITPMTTVTRTSIRTVMRRDVANAGKDMLLPPTVAWAASL
ncbi:MAG: hypothetical protein DDT38_00089 [Firmicutes bacterium]|nr:hypothetical protein [candidate division NPL-UPA2 bacterium]